MRSTVVYMLGLIASLSLSPFRVIGQTARNDNQHRYDLTEYRRLGRTISSQPVSAQPAQKIPFELSGNQIFLRGQVNGSARSLWFLLDTGASRSVFNATQARRLGLKPEGQETGSTPLGPLLFPAASCLMP
jgi:predicted aspartyl protease